MSHVSIRHEKKTNSAFGLQNTHLWHIWMIHELRTYSTVYTPKHPPETHHTYGWVVHREHILPFALWNTLLSYATHMHETRTENILPFALHNTLLRPTYISHVPRTCSAICPPQHPPENCPRRVWVMRHEHVLPFPKHQHVTDMICHLHSETPAWAMSHICMSHEPRTCSPICAPEALLKEPLQQNVTNGHRFGVSSTIFWKPPFLTSVFKQFSNNPDLNSKTFAVWLRIGTALTYLPRICSPICAREAHLKNVEHIGLFLEI